MKLLKYKFGYVVSIGPSEEEARLNLYYRLIEMIIGDDAYRDMYPYVSTQIEKNAICIGQTDKSVDEHKFWE